MSTSRNSGHSDAGTSLSVPVDGLPSLSRYDALLVLIPLGFVLSLVASLTLGIELHEAVVVGAVVGTVSLADALFLNPPVDGRK